MHKVEESFAAAEVEVEFADRTEEELYRLAVMGENTRAFFESPHGRYLIGAAAQDLNDIQEKLLTVSPWRKRKIQALQMEAASIKRSIAWLQEVLQRGVEAEGQLRQYREN